MEPGRSWMVAAHLVEWSATVPRHVITPRRLPGPAAKAIRGPNAVETCRARALPPDVPQRPPGVLT